MVVPPIYILSVLAAGSVKFFPKGADRILLLSASGLKKAGPYIFPAR